MQQYTDGIVKALKAGGYRQLNSDSKIVYGRAEGNTVYIVVVGRQNGLTADMLRMFDEKIKRDIVSNVAGRNGTEPDVRLLNILITPDGMFDETVMSIVNGVRNVWLFTEDCGRLYVYEEQPDDFDGLHASLDAICSEKPQRVRTYSGLLPGAVTLTLIAVNVLVCIAGLIAARGSFQYVLEYRLAVNVSAIHDRGQYYRLLTSMFAHFGFVHLFGNMIVLAALGARAERIFGKLRYLCAYLAAGLVSSYASYMVCRAGISEYDYAAGASGAIMGMLGMLTAVAVKSRGRAEDVSLRDMILYFVLCVGDGFLSDEIDNVAHIAGYAAGLIFGIVLILTNQKVVKDVHM